MDSKGNHVYSLDLAGGSLPDDYVTTGSGSPYVYGVLEDQYEQGITADEGTDLAIRAITAAMKRDAASGDGLTVVRITPDGFDEISDDEIAKRTKKMNLT